MASQIVATQKPDAKASVVPATSRSTVMSVKDFESLFKEVKALYKKCSEGFSTFPEDPKYKQAVAESATYLLELLKDVNELYKKYFDALEPPRTASLKPSLVDRKIGEFLTTHFGLIPDYIGNKDQEYSVVDLNTILPRAVSIVMKRRGLQEGPFCKLDAEFIALFTSPSINNKNKTYLQLTQERISEKRAKPDYKEKSSSARIITTENQKDIRINFAALKILFSTMKNNYVINNPENYTARLEEMAKTLADIKKNSDIESKEKSELDPKDKSKKTKKVAK